MSCGPSEKLKELADQVAAAEKKFDTAVNESPLGKINEIKKKSAITIHGNERYFQILRFCISFHLPDFQHLSPICFPIRLFLFGGFERL